MTLHEITKKLTGEIQPVGETHTDERRFKNLEEAIELCDRLLFDIGETARFADRPEASMSKAGKRAKEFMEQVRDEII